MNMHPCPPFRSPMSAPAIIFMASPTTKYRARFDFPYQNVLQACADYVPDILLVNQVETAPAVRAIAQELPSTPLVVAYCHYLPYAVEEELVRCDPSLDDHQLGTPVVLSFLAGLSAADHIFVHSQTAKQYVDQLTTAFAVRPGATISVLPPPLDPALVMHAPSTSLNRGRIAYNHRLYEHYGTAKFVELAELLHEQLDVEVLVLDPTSKSSTARRSLDPSPTKYAQLLEALPNIRVVRGLDGRATYRDLLQSCALTIAPFRENCTWSMSCVDSESMGIPVVGPRMAWFEEHLPFGHLYDSPEDAVNVIKTLLDDDEAYRTAVKHSLYSTSALTPEQIASDFVSALMSRARVAPLAYDDLFVNSK